MIASICSEVTAGAAVPKEIDFVFPQSDNSRRWALAAGLLHAMMLRGPHAPSEASGAS